MEWDEQNIILYDEKSNFAKWISPAGICFDVKAIEEDSKYRAYKDEHVFVTKRTVNGAVYTVKHWLFNGGDFIYLGEYYTIEKTTPDGECELVYKANALSEFCVIMILWGSWFILAISMTVLSWKYQKRGRS